MGGAGDDKALRARLVEALEAEDAADKEGLEEVRFGPAGRTRQDRVRNLLWKRGRVRRARRGRGRGPASALTRRGRWGRATTATRCRPSGAEAPRRPLCDASRYAALRRLLPDRASAVGFSGYEAPGPAVVPAPLVLRRAARGADVVGSAAVGGRLERGAPREAPPGTAAPRSPQPEKPRPISFRTP